jgi:hypothetical protein
MKFLVFISIFSMTILQIGNDQIIGTYRITGISKDATGKHRFIEEVVVKKDGKFVYRIGSFIYGEGSPHFETVYKGKWLVVNSGKELELRCDSMNQEVNQRAY